MKTIFTLFICTIISLNGFTQRKFREIDFIDGELYIKLKKMKTFTKANAQINVKGELAFLDKVSSDVTLLTASKPFFSSNSTELQKIYRIKVQAKDINTYIKSLQAQPDIEYVERIERIKLESVPNDYYVSLSLQNYLNQIKAFEAWDVRSPIREVKVAIVDNAIQTNHRDLAANMLAGYDVSDDDDNPNPPNDTFNHGTHVAGIAGAVTNNSRGMASASNNAVKIIPIKATGDDGIAGTIENGYEGIVWAADNGANIINCSWSGVFYTKVKQDVISYALSKGCLIIAAAGNSDEDIIGYPAGMKGVVAVGSLDETDLKSTFSNYGYWVDITAPGNMILSTIPTNKYLYMYGTSMASPLIAACLGYIWACFPDLSREELIELMERTADDISLVNLNYIGQLGAGRVNLLTAIKCGDLGYKTMSVTSTNTPFVCKGQSVFLEATNIAGGVYQWYKNDTLLVRTGQQFSATEAGMYKVKFMKDACSLISKPLKVGVTTLKSPTPIVNQTIVSYCSPTDKGPTASVASCKSGTQTFTYTGGTIGFDNYTSSVNTDPNVFTTLDVGVSGMAGYITKVSVSVTWEKKNQTNANACDLADLGGSPHYEEVAFALLSPSGKYTILQNLTYVPGIKNSGKIVSIFDDEALDDSFNSNPRSGTYSPFETLKIYVDDDPNGIWSLFAYDIADGNPLCVSGFSITITTNIPSQNPTISWWDAKGSLVKQGNELLLANNLLGVQKFTVGNQCEGFCPSDPIEVEYVVKPVPEIAVFPMTDALTNQLRQNLDLSSTNINYKKDKLGNTIIYYEINGHLKEMNLGNVTPLTNPITICSSSENYLITANGCPTNTITWSDGQNGQNLIVKPASTIGYNAYCHQNWNNCTPIISNLVHFITPDHHPYPIIDEIKANNIQKFVQNNIIASNKINTPAKIDYRGIKSIELKPGFQVEGNSVFKAEIKGCND